METYVDLFSNDSVLYGSTKLVLALTIVGTIAIIVGIIVIYKELTISFAENKINHNSVCAGLSIASLGVAASTFKTALWIEPQFRIMYLWASVLFFMLSIILMVISIKKL